jgi:hypothetical protein
MLKSACSLSLLEAQAAGRDILGFATGLAKLKLCRTACRDCLTFLKEESLIVNVAVIWTVYLERAFFGVEKDRVVRTEVPRPALHRQL